MSVPPNDERLAERAAAWSYAPDDPQFPYLTGQLIDDLAGDLARVCVELGNAERDFEIVADDRQRLRAELTEALNGYEAAVVRMKALRAELAAKDAECKTHSGRLDDVTDIARAALSWAPGNAKITLAQRLEDALAVSPVSSPGKDAA